VTTSRYKSAFKPLISPRLSKIGFCNVGRDRFRCLLGILFEEGLNNEKIILSMIASLLIGVLLLPGKSAFALDKINVTLPSKSFQFIIFPLAKERVI